MGTTALGINSTKNQFLVNCDEIKEHSFYLFIYFYYRQGQKGAPPASLTQHNESTDSVKEVIYCGLLLVSEEKPLGTKKTAQTTPVPIQAILTTDHL